jgi:hypothetical protein
VYHRSRGPFETTSGSKIYCLRLIGFGVHDHVKGPRKSDYIIPGALFNRVEWNALHDQKLWRYEHRFVPVKTKSKVKIKGKSMISKKLYQMLLTYLPLCMQHTSPENTFSEPVEDWTCGWLELYNDKIRNI